ncbi:hypothetical protein [Paracoccus hibiscisoli]|uniref:Uncharacterized protein n=1 Tax=Paracoccus hibiscisoli TaxID=2023261 RepID=A0A4U0QGG4_9RHOB|nr:hypothetical protein [Paracoccus hibiscisoli]TJZ79892.1 hypothetical protein FA740_17735 [Paracoccus hibiscisoli]
MANAILTLGDLTAIEGTADPAGDTIRFTPSSAIDAEKLTSGITGHLKINGIEEPVKLDSAGPAYINGTGTLMSLRKIRRTT